MQAALSQRKSFGRSKIQEKKNHSIDLIEKNQEYDLNDKNHKSIAKIESLAITDYSISE